MLTTELIARTGWHLGTRHYSDWNGRDQATQCRHAPNACLVSNPSRTTTQAEREGQVEWQLSRLCGQMSHQRHGSTTHRWRAVEGTDTILQSDLALRLTLHCISTRSCQTLSPSLSSWSSLRSARKWSNNAAMLCTNQMKMRAWYVMLIIVVLVSDSCLVRWRRRTIRHSSATRQNEHIQHGRH